MKYLKYFDNNFFYELKNIKEYAIITALWTESLFIMNTISTVNNEYLGKQLYHCLKNGDLFKENRNINLIKIIDFQDYKLIYHSDSLKDCIDYIVLLNNSKKYNL